MKEEFVYYPHAENRTYIDRILDIGRTEDNSAREKHEHAAVVFLEMMQYLHAQYYSATQNYSPETTLLKEYIDNHITENISLKELKDMVYLSGSQLIRIFKQDMNVTPHEYILNLKMEHAETLLKSTSLMVKEIAFQ